MSDSKAPSAEALSFNSTTFDVVERAGKVWLKAVEIGRALGYVDDKAVQRIYARHADEFTQEMTGVVNLTTPSGKQDSRVFSLRGAHLLAMFARTKVAKAFRKWVLDVLDREVERLTQERAPSMSLTDCGDKAQVGKYLIAARKRAVQHLAQLEKQITHWEVVDEVPAKTRQLLADVKFVAHAPGQECTLHIICGDCGWSVQVPADGVPECGVVVGDKVRLEYDDAVNPLMGPFKRVVILERAKVTQAAAMPPAQAKEVTDRLDRLGKLFHPFSQQFSDVNGIGRALRGMDPKVGNRHHGFLPLLPKVGDQLGVAA